MTTPNVPSMNAMVDSITDTVENAIICGNQSGGVHRFMVQGAVRPALRDIHHQRIPLRCSNSHQERRSPALGTVLYIRDAGTPPQPPATPVPLLPWTGDGGGTMAARRGGPLFPTRDANAEKWPPGFAYDITIAPPPPPPQHLLRSYADIASNRRNALPSGSTLGAGFVSSEEGAFPVTPQVSSY